MKNSTTAMIETFTHSLFLNYIFIQFLDDLLGIINFHDDAIIYNNSFINMSDENKIIAMEVINNLEAYGTVDYNLYLNFAIF